MPSPSVPLQSVLGIESSCDETAAAIVRGRPGEMEVLSSIVYTQADLHANFGGVVPEIAARAHAERLDLCIEAALEAAGHPLEALDAIAVTCGPGLIGGVISGVVTAKALSAVSGLPLYGINHLAGHALTPRLSDKVEYPYLMLLVSGGHCQFLIVHNALKYERLGGTIDDAPGEAFDKVARLLGLAQPGGPSIERAAQNGDPKSFALPRPLLNKPGCNLSFSGLKTAVLRARDALVDEQGGLTVQNQNDLSAAFQAAIVDCLMEKTRRAIALYRVLAPQTPTLCVAGGVAANQAIRKELSALARDEKLRFVAPAGELCTDNAAMIAAAAIEEIPLRPADDDRLSARPRMPLDRSQTALLGSGKKGAKA